MPIWNKLRLYWNRWSRRCIIYCMYWWVNYRICEQLVKWIQLHIYFNFRTKKSICWNQPLLYDKSAAKPSTSTSTMSFTPIYPATQCWYAVMVILRNFHHSNWPRTRRETLKRNSTESINTIQVWTIRAKLTCLNRYTPLRWRKCIALLPNRLTISVTVIQRARSGILTLNSGNFLFSFFSYGSTGPHRSVM